MFDVAMDIEKYRSDCINPLGKELFIDSGGYSFIKGDVHPRDTKKMIECYCTYLEKEAKVYDRIFTLDLPVNLKHTEFNTKSNVEKWNRVSLELTAEVLKRNPGITPKLYFVWQFKMKAQYAIWCRLYEELGLKSVVMNHAIGGLVGLSKATGARFAAFIGMAYKCLFEHRQGDFREAAFRLHFLGVYARSDRFVIAILNALFQAYVGKVELTYDTINYSISAQKRVKDLPVYRYHNRELESYHGLVSTPGYVFDEVYTDHSLRNGVDDALGCLSKGKKIDDITLFAPLNVHSNVALDRLFMDIVADYEIAETIKKRRSFLPASNRLKTALDDMTSKHPDVFTKDLASSVEASLKAIWQFHRWYLDARDKEGLERLMAAFIAMIKFPFDLE
jgi:hypothetical protein